MRSNSSRNVVLPLRFNPLSVRRFGVALFCLCLCWAVAFPASAQWEPSPVNTKSTFHGISVVNDKVVWIAGTHGTVARSVDGAHTWTVNTVPDAANLTFDAIAGFSANVAVTVSAGAAEKVGANIFRTTDGGKTWTRVYSTTMKGVFFDTLAFWNTTHGLALSDPVDGHLFLLSTDDGGKSWTRIPPGRLPAMLPNEQFMATSATCLAMWGSSNAWIGSATAAKARVFRTADRGRTWSVADTLVTTNKTSGISALAFRDALHGIAVGGNIALKGEAAMQNVALTDDGGRTWRIARGPRPPVFLWGLSYADGGKTIVGVGFAGTYISVDGGESWTGIDKLRLFSDRFSRDGKLGVAAGPGGVYRFQGSPAAFAKPVGETH